MAEMKPNSGGLVGQTADGYVFLKEIGTGAASVVYQAMEPAANNKLLAIKVLDRAEQALAGGENARNPFIRERKIAERFSEPGILRVFRTGELFDGRFYMAMELVQGMTLAEELRHRGSIPWDEAVDISASVAWSVTPLHEARIIHRDITPGNVMVRMGKDGHIHTKLIDFGSARWPGEWDADLAEPIGTPQYMAPEQAAGRGTTKQSDVYSMGALLYEMLAGKPAIDVRRPTAEACRDYLLEDKPIPSVPLADVATDVPSEILAFVTRALARDPGDRPSDAFAFGHELSDAADAADAAAERRASPVARLKDKLGGLFSKGRSG